MKILIAIPVYNEENILENNINKVLDFCHNKLDIDFKIVIADNNSTDKTAEIGRQLADKNSEVEYYFIDQQGKGGAIKNVWANDYSADIYCFMDADLATDLSALPNLISEINNGNDIVIGSRFHSKSKVSRPLSRKIISYLYHLFLKISVRTKINDAACGFKAISKKAKLQLLPDLQNEGWFFDSELVLLADKSGYKVKEIPVCWAEPRTNDSPSKVNIWLLSRDYLKQVSIFKKNLRNLYIQK